jgi:tryptophan synthase beta chain
VESLRITLEQSEIPTHWYNVVADMPNPPVPPLGADGKPVSPEQMGRFSPAILDAGDVGRALDSDP